jgi:membrane associated rhomboid family serine protease
MIVAVVPYATDAPIYHWPYATVGTIIANAIAALLTWPIMWSADPNDAQSNILALLVLRYGYFNPIAWIASNYLHADPFHLIGNMVMLWAFGIIVEGKIGWWRFLLLYNAIGFFQCGLEQVLTMGFDEGESLGASAIIYGLIAISLIWAPLNEMQCILFYWICLLVRIMTFECSVLMLAGMSIFLQMGLAVIQVAIATGREMSMAPVITSAVLHVMGAATGFALGFVMLKLKWVDCENYDLLSVRAGRHEMTEEDRKAEFAASAEGQALEANKRQQALDEFRRHLAENQPLAALAVYRRTKQRHPDWKPPENDYIVLIALLRKLRLYNQAAPAMVEYLRAYAERAVPVRLALAEVLIEHLQRPGQALAVLAKLNGTQLDAAQRQLVEKLGSKAQAAYERDPYEVAPEDW